MKLMTLLTLALFAISCSHHHKESKHHHHEDEMTKKGSPEFGKKCAHSVMEGDTHVEGKEEFQISHEGHVYYFSTKEKMDQFNKDLAKNVQKANRNWKAEQIK